MLSESSGWCAGRALVSQLKGRGFDPEINGCILKRANFPLAFHKAAVALQELTRVMPGVRGCPLASPQGKKLGNISLENSSLEIKSTL